jgi:hypothetical protein
MKKTQMVFAIVLLTAAAPVASASGPGKPPEFPPSNGGLADASSSGPRCVALPQPQCLPPAASLGSGPWYGQGA